MSTDPRVARTRERVLGAAWELLNEVGFDGVTVELVSARSGVARSTMYRHWRSMPELLRDAFATQATANGDTEGCTATGAAALQAYARAFAVGLCDQWGRAALSLAASAALDPAQRAVQQVFVQGTRRDLRTIVAGSGLPGDVEEAVDRLVDLVIAPLFYRFQFTERAASPEQAARLAEQAWAAVGGH